MTRLNWGLIGGGEGSQIGPAHRLGAGLDGRVRLRRGRARSPARGGAGLRATGWASRPDRAYGDWREMLAGERRARRPYRPRDRRHAQRHAFRDHQGLPRSGLPRALREADDDDGRGRRGDRRHRAASGTHLRRQLRLHRLLARPPHEGDGRARRPRAHPPRRCGIRPWPPRRCRRRRQPARPLAL